MEFFEHSSGVYVFYFFLHFLCYTIFGGMLIFAAIHVKLSSQEASLLYADWTSFETANVAIVFHRTTVIYVFWTALCVLLLVLFGYVVKQFDGGKLFHLAPALRFG